MEKKTQRERVLGIDLGTSSVGWALVEYEQGEAKRIVDAGVRIFEAGVEGDIQSGRDESRNKTRRDKRMQRRQFDRRARRLANVARLLQSQGMLPPGNFEDKQVLHETLGALDRDIYQKYSQTLPAKVRDNRAFAHVLPYWLRAHALDANLEPYELGRALYHLAQRRGFLSNRKAEAKKESEEERSQVKKSIIELENKIKEAGARTLGEYYSMLDPEEERIRGRWTSREKMYKPEFEAIWKAQQPHHPEALTDEFRKRLYRAIFHQRPLKSSKHLIGKCELEPPKPRAPWALLEAQRFRLLQKVNDLQIMPPDAPKRPLTPEQRQKLLDALELEGDKKFTEIRTLLKLPKKTAFSHEAGGEGKITGNRTASKLYAVFGDRWTAMSEEDREQVIRDIRTIRQEDVLARRGKRVWGLSDEQAEAFGSISLEPEYCSLSKEALRKVLPLMEKGIPFMTAVREAYPERWAVWNVLDQLPPVERAPLGELRNPMVGRSLNELRKVVNGVINKHGKPDTVRIELARDLKRARSEREAISKKNRDNEKGRSKAAQRILDECGIQHPKRDAVERVLLAEECDWKCPYTGRSISIGSLLGDSPQFDVEHIIPFSRSLDNSFLNKTLCYHEENRCVKKEKTPFEAYHGTERWEEIVGRVKDFQGPAARAKLERFLMQDLETFEDFSKRQLADTRYASKLAGNFLALLYGGENDAGGTKRIQAGRGQITAYLRRVWKLNGILGDGDQKSRDDHRHHVVDAICIALTSAATVKMLSDAAKRAAKENRRQFGAVPEPWEGFLDDVKRTIEGVLVSHRVSRKVNGPLHEETIYGNGAEEGYCHVRKPIAGMSQGEIEAIVDPEVRRLVKESLGGGDPKKVFAEPARRPAFVSPDGRRIRINKARIKKKLTPFPVGAGHRQRLVVTDSNHHVEIVEVIDKRGNTKWEGHVVSRFEAMQRKRLGQPIVRRDHGTGKKFVYSLTLNDTIQMRNDKGEIVLYQVAGISQFTSGAVVIDLKVNTDARPISKISRQGRTRTPETLRQSEGQKVLITPLGEIRRASD